MFKYLFRFLGVGGGLMVCFLANVCGCSVSFILTGLLVWRDDRANKVGGGASYA